MTEKRKPLQIYFSEAEMLRLERLRIFHGKRSWADVIRAFVNNKLTK